MPNLPLPHQLFLLSHQPGKGRLDDDSHAVLGSLLCGAAVAELRLSGRLRDRGGKAERTELAPPPDPFLARVLDVVDRPRGWFDVLERQWLTAEETVEDQLAAAGVIHVEQHRVLGLIPAKQITVADPAPVQALRDRVRGAAQRDNAAAPATIGEAVLAALAVDGNVSTVFGWRDLRGRKQAVRALNDRVDRELPGLRSALIQSIALRRAG